MPRRASAPARRVGAGTEITATGRSPFITVRYQEGSRILADRCHRSTDGFGSSARAWAYYSERSGRTSRRAIPLPARGERPSRFLERRFVDVLGEGHVVREGGRQAADFQCIPPRFVGRGPVGGPGLESEVV